MLCSGLDDIVRNVVMLKRLLVLVKNNDFIPLPELVFVTSRSDCMEAQTRSD